MLLPAQTARTRVRFKLIFYGYRLHGKMSEAGTRDKSGVLEGVC